MRLKKPSSPRPFAFVCAGGMAAALSVASQSAVAQDAQDAQIQRVEVTGSSIKRIAAEGALPVTVLTAKPSAFGRHIGHRSGQKTVFRPRGPLMKVLQLAR